MQAQSYTNELLAGMQRVEESWKRVRSDVEEAAIRAMEPAAENLYAPAGGEPIIVTVREGVEV